MDAEFLKTNLHFKEGIKGSYYKRIDGFLYTVDPTSDSETVLYINLPEVTEDTKKAFIQFLKDNVKKFLKARIVKNGVKLTLTTDALNKKSYIPKIAQQISAYLSGQDIAFKEAKPEIDYKNNMYVFVENISEDAAEDISAEAEEVIEESPIPVLEEETVENGNAAEVDEPKEENPFKKSYGTQIVLIAIYAVCAIVFLLLSLISANVAAVTGYFMGWLPTEYLVKKHYPNKKIFWVVTGLSLSALLLAGGYSFVFALLSQNEIYTASEFFLQSLKPAHYVFNVILALLLSMFGSYLSLPAKKKPKTEKDEDFE